MALGRRETSRRAPRGTLLTTLLTALVLAGGLLVATPATAWDADYGHVARDNGVLKAGCANYWFRYRVRPGNNEWGAEFFLRDPNRERIASANRHIRTHPKRGRAKFEVCRSITRPGRFKITGKLTITRRTLTGGYVVEAHWVKPDTFRLRRP